MNKLTIFSLIFIIIGTFLAILDGFSYIATIRIYTFGLTNPDPIKFYLIRDKISTIGITFIIIGSFIYLLSAEFKRRKHLHLIE